MATNFTAACNKYFGRKKGQSLSEFASELAQLTPEDKAEMAVGLSAILGEEVTVAPVATQAT